MRFIGNILWFLFGGIVLATLWFLAGLVCCLSIIGIPLGVQCFKFASLMLWPFGRDIDYSQAGFVSLIANVVWIVFFGWELAVSALGVGILYCLTIIGVPFGLQAFKFARLALVPFGARIVRLR